MQDDLTPAPPELPDSQSGYVAIVGRPNVGKSTLLNQILGQKISITSRKPQTTRHQILGVKTEGAQQVMYVDTPGLHKNQTQALNRYMNKAASSALKDVDLVVFVVDRTGWTEEDDLVLEHVSTVRCPVLLAVNKVDLLKDKDVLLPHIEMLAEKLPFAAILPISAKRANNVAELEEVILKYLPAGMHYFPEDQVTDRSQRFLAAELVREKLMRRLGQELPYQLTVEIEEFSFDGKTLHISALILVERDTQKQIIIGNKGQQIKAIGQDARLEMEHIFDNKVMLKLWVKVKSGWSDDERALKSLGYDD